MPPISTVHFLRCTTYKVYYIVSQTIQPIRDLLLAYPLGPFCYPPTLLE